MLQHLPAKGQTEHAHNLKMDYDIMMSLKNMEEIEFAAIMANDFVTYGYAWKNMLYRPYVEDSNGFQSPEYL